MPPLRNILGFSLLIAAAAVSWWAADMLLPKEPPPQKLEGGKVDYYSKNIHRTVMDDAGWPREVLVAQTLTHYEHDGHTELQDAEMTLIRKSGPPWVIRADLAELPVDADDIFLYGSVVITRGPDQSGRTVRIETSNARVQPGRNYAETDDYIRVLSPPDYMSGTGAQVSFADDLNFTILADVRRKHEVTDR